MARGRQPTPWATPQPCDAPTHLRLRLGCLLQQALAAALRRLHLAPQQPEAELQLRLIAAQALQTGVQGALCLCPRVQRAALACSLGLEGCALSTVCHQAGCSGSAVGLQADLLLPQRVHLAALGGGGGLERRGLVGQSLQPVGRSLSRGPALLQQALLRLVLWLEGQSQQGRHCGAKVSTADLIQSGPVGGAAAARLGH